MDPCTTDTKTLLKQLTAQYYDDLNHAHERGQKVVWTNGLFPQEFFDEETAADSILVQKALEGMRELKDQDLLTLIALIDRLKVTK